MRAQERHKLKTNQLVAYVERVGQWLKRRARLLVGILIVVLLALGLLWFIRYRQQVQMTNAWNELGQIERKLIGGAPASPSEEGLLFAEALARSDAATADQFGRVAKNYPNNPPVTTEALYYQAFGLAEQARRGRGGDEQKRRAESILHEIVEQRPYSPLVTPLARLELAQIAFTRSDFNKVREHYAAVETDPKADVAMRQSARMFQSQLGQLDQISYDFYTAGTEAVVPIPPPETQPATTPPAGPTTGGRP